jgi:hypothetical protein
MEKNADVFVIFREPKQMNWVIPENQNKLKGTVNPHFHIPMNH